jgi:predicted peptidase
MKSIVGVVFLILVASLTTSSVTYADNVYSGEHFVGETINVRGFSIPYAVYLPIGYTPERRWPVILSLHGTGECGNDGWAPTRVGLGQSIAHHPEWFSAIVIFPQCPSALRWTSQMSNQAGAPFLRELVIAALDHVLTQYHGDPGRVTLTGLSLGGQGVWDLGAREPHRFVALMPISGRRIEKDLIRALVGKPIWVIQGAKDDVVPVEESQYMVDQLIADGAKHVRFTVIPGAGHDAWDSAYNDPEAINFLIR